MSPGLSLKTVQPAAFGRGRKKSPFLQTILTIPGFEIITNDESDEIEQETTQKHHRMVSNVRMKTDYKIELRNDNISITDSLLGDVRIRIRIFVYLMQGW